MRTRAKTTTACLIGFIEIISIKCYQDNQIEMNQIQQVKLIMKKQAQRSSRQTPPFVEYVGVEEHIKLALSQNDTQKLIGIKEMQQINLHKQQLNVDEILRKRKQKRTKNNEGRKQNLKKKAKGSEKNNADKNILLPNHKYDEQLEENSELSSEFTQKKSNQRQKKKIKSKEKCIDQNKDKTHKRKKNSKEKVCVIQQKQSEDKSRCKINSLHHFSECIYPASQDLRQVYNIHANRQKNNRSYNAEYRTKIQHHRKLFSECFKVQKQKGTLKKQPLKKIAEQEMKNMSDSKNLTRLKDIRIVHEVLKSSSLDSLDYYRLQTNDVASQKEEDEDKVLRLEANNIGGTNKRILEQLYNQSDSYGQYDSQDQKLLTMISQDTQIMRMNMGEKNTKMRNQIMIGMNGGKVLNEQHLMKINMVEKQKQQQLPVSKNNKEELIKTIDSILNQISNFSDKKIQQPKIAEEFKQKLQQNSDNSRSSSFSSTFSAGELALFRSDKWNSLPSVLELEVILDNCLAQGLSLERSRVIPKLKKQNENGPKNRIYDNNEKKQLEREQKWKFNQAKGIEKAKKLLKIGLYQATKLLNINSPSEISSKKRGEIKGNSEKDSNYAQKRLRIKCKSMMSLKYLQNYPDPDKLKRQQKQEQSLNSKRMEPSMLNQQVIVEKMKQSNRIELFPQDNTNNDDYSKQKLAALTTKQVQEIIEFICLDLYIGFIQQIQIEFDSPINLFESLYQSLSKLRTSKKLGFSTAPKDIYNLLQKLSEFLEQTKDIDKDGQKSLKQIIFERIKNSIGPKPNQLLKFMREVEYEPEEEAQALEEKESFALSSTWFHEFSQRYVNQFDFGIYYFMDQDRESKRKSFLKNAMHVHNKAIFDSINQIIDNYRPFGVIGQPFPWKKFLKPPQPNFNIILNKTFEKVIQNSKYLCGIFSEQHMGRSLTSEQYLEFSEDRLNKILCKDIQDNQIRWNFIDDEQTQVLIQVSKHLQRNLIIQTVKQILKVSNSKMQVVT